MPNAATQELLRALDDPQFKLSALAQDGLLADYLPFTTVVKLPLRSPITPLCRDPADMSFLQLAAASGAQV